jgi:hypothetical protein
MTNRLDYIPPEAPQPKQPRPSFARWALADFAQAWSASAAASARPAAAAPTLVDGQLIRLAGESFPLTAVSGVAVVYHDHRTAAFWLALFGVIWLIAWLSSEGGSASVGIGISFACFWGAAYGWQRHYSLRINLNNGRLIEIPCASSQSAFAGRSEMETALARRVQPVVRGQTETGGDPVAASGAA